MSQENPNPISRLPEMQEYLKSLRAILLDQADHCERVCRSLGPFLDRVEEELESHARSQSGGDGWLDFESPCEDSTVKTQRATLKTMRATIEAMDLSSKTIRAAVLSNNGQAIRLARECLKAAQRGLDEGRTAFKSAFAKTAPDEEKIRECLNKAHREVQSTLSFSNQSLMLTRQEPPQTQTPTPSDVPN
jgi:small-conductance mechanosensitive channel